MANFDAINFIKGNIEKSEVLGNVKKEFAQCLQVENLNFLIGSGCSSYWVEGEEKSIPIMSGLAHRFYDANSGFSIQNVEMKDKFPSNLESLMEYMTAVKLVNEVSIVDDKIDDKIKIVQQFIREQIVDGMTSDEVTGLYKEFYLRIIRKNRQSPINVFTTNYDMYNEKALDSLGFFYNNGFTGTYERRFNPISYNYTYVENMDLNKDVWGRISNFYNLFKIHGSINWVNDNGKVIEKPITSTDEEKIMIYPTPLKDRTTLMTPYSDLLRNMQQSLMKNNSILITMGYSFSDDHINRIILNMLSVPSFRLVILGDGDNVNKLREMNDSRIWIINSTDKIHYFNNIVEHLLPTVHDELKEMVELKERFHILDTILKGDE